MLVLGATKGCFDALFGGGFGVGLGVADGESSLVLGDGFLAVGQDVVEAAEVDVRPGEGAGFLRGVEDGLEVPDGGPGLTLHQVDAGEDVVGLGVVAVGIGEDLVGDVGGTGEISLEDLHLSELEAGELGCGAAQNVVAAVGQEGDLLVLVALAVDVHAVDHLAHVFLEADAVLSPSSPI